MGRFHIRGAEGELPLIGRLLLMGGETAPATAHPMCQSARVAVDTVNITPKVTSVVRAFVNMTTQLLSPPPTPSVVNMPADVPPPTANMQPNPTQQMPTPVTSSEATPVNPGVDPLEGMPCLPLEPRITRHRDVSSYRPAALRPVDRPLRQTAMTPPQSSGNSIESLQMTDSRGSLSRPGTVGSASSWGQQREGRHPYSQVTGPPKQDHWKVS